MPWTWVQTVLLANVDSNVCWRSDANKCKIFCVTCDSKCANMNFDQDLVIQAVLCSSHYVNDAEGCVNYSLFLLCLQTVRLHS